MFVRIMCVFVALWLTTKAYADPDPLVKLLNLLTQGGDALCGPVLREGANGQVHVAYHTGWCIRYAKADIYGDSLIDIPLVPLTTIVERIGLAVCRDVPLVLYGPYERNAKFLLLDTDGTVVDSGEIQRTRTCRTFMTSDSNAALFHASPRSGGEKEPPFNFPVIFRSGATVLYGFTWPLTTDLVGTIDFHMVGDSNLYVFTHPYTERPGPGKQGGGVDWLHLEIYNYNTWLGSITDSMLIPLDKNSDFLSDDAIPFAGVQVVDDTSGNMIVFASYVDPEHGLHLRLFTLTPDLKVLPPPKFDIRRDQSTIQISKEVKQKRLFWLTPNDLFGGTAGLHQIALVGDTLFHQSIYGKVPEPEK